MATDPTCLPAPIGIYNRLTELLVYLEANLKLPACADDYCQLLADIITELQLVVTNTGGGASAVAVTATNPTNATGTVPANWKSVIFINQGTTTCTILGVSCNPGVSINAGDFGASPTNALAWTVPAGGDLLIIEAR